jgi:uncharacterized membrane protein
MQNTVAPPVRFGDWISEGWKMFTEQWKGWVVLSLGLLLVAALPATLMMISIFAGSFLAASETSMTGEPSSGLPAFLSLGVVGILFVLMFPLSVLLMGGMYKSAIKQLRGGRVEFSDLFSARDRFLTLFLGLLAIWILTSIGGLLCVFPAFVVAGLLMFTVPLIVDRNLSVGDALRTSYEVTRPNWLMFTLFAFVVQLIASLGYYACFVGLVVTYPLLFTMTAVAYRDCFGIAGARSFLPPAGAQAPYAQPPSAVSPQYNPPPPPIQAPPRQATPPPPQPVAVTCGNCQMQLPPTAAFCPRCGSSITR